MQEIRLGLTMRITNAQNYHEDRESIAYDWVQYLNTYFPNIKWLLIPNNPDTVIEYIRKWELNTFILSGGDNIGIYPRRDETELKIIKYALKNNNPIIGICRGMQIIYSYFGGTLIKGNADFCELHRAKRHLIKTYEDKYIEVNSYHENFIKENDIPKNLKILAKDKTSNSIEAFQGENILTFMWHPERENGSEIFSLKLISNLIYREGKYV